MSTPGTQVAAYSQGVVSTEPVDPSAVSSAKSGAVFALGEVLKTVLHKLPVFSVETDLDNAISVINKFVSAFVPGGEMDALVTGAERAVKEDVSQRIPPGGVVPNVYTGPQLDYTKLAQAILAEQRKTEVTSGK
jgi:hypothetical protein